MYQAFVERLSLTLKTVGSPSRHLSSLRIIVQRNEQTQRTRLLIEAQKKFVDKLVELTNIVRRMQGSAKAKV